MRFGSYDEPAPAPPGADALQHSYRVLRRVLASNSDLLEQLADLEADLCHFDPGQRQIRQPVLRLLDGALLLAENLNILTADRHVDLYERHREIEREVRSYLASFASQAGEPLVLSLDEAGQQRASEVGGKAANLGELRAAMPEVVPPGFVITTAAYRLLLEEGDLHHSIRRLLQDLSLITERDLFGQRTAAIRALVESSAVPKSVSEAIQKGVASLPEPRPALFAVRSSGVGEDGRLSFAGQFESYLNVPPDELADAYRKVIASRYSDRAVLYRIICGFSEVATPMAVLFLPMIDARAAGVLYTRDPSDASADQMMINAVRGLADEMVRGGRAADTYRVSRSRMGAIVERREAGRSQEGEQSRAPSADDSAPSSLPASLTPDDLTALAAVALRIEDHFGKAQDIEWVVDHGGYVTVVQSRPLRLEEGPRGEPSKEARSVLLEGGITVFPGRAVGPAHVALTREDLVGVPEGAILVVSQATPELTSALTSLAGVIAAQGNPAGHAATLIREFGVPAVFGMPDAASRLTSGMQLSLDATHRRVYEGGLWPEVRERVRSRIRHARSGQPASLIHERILALNLTDPFSLAFSANHCRSIHDIIRYTHEKAVGAMFDLGDAAVRRGQRRVWRLRSPVPLYLTILDLGGSLPAAARERHEVQPEEIDSVPFQALWRGVTTPGLTWAGRTQVSAAGFASVLASAMLDSGSAVRELGATNYVIVGPDYLNVNARLAYHFAMIDALISDAPENNYVNFRFRGGGAGIERRDLRARFLSEVLLRSSFGVDRRGDLVTAWLRSFPKTPSEEGLTLVGRLMACARQLDMLMSDEPSMRHFIERFLVGDYGAFA